MNGELVLVLIFIGLIVLTIRKANREGADRDEWKPGWGPAGTEDRPFQPTAIGPGIAIDDNHDWLWLLADGHGAILVEKTKIRDWKHEWVDSQRDGGGRIRHLRNFLVLRLADNERPVVKVSFGPEYTKAEEWQARLTTWING